MTTLFQYSHFWAVNHGAYEGNLRIDEIFAHGNTGLGTFNGLDGELVLINNKAYHCTGGKARLAHTDELLAWCAIAPLASPQAINLSNVKDLAQLSYLLRTHFSSENFPYVISLQGEFANIKVGSVPKQQKPYLPIETVIKDSLYFDTGTITATLVGFFAPTFLFPIKSSGLHFHFVSDDLEQGGHVLDCQITNAALTFTRLEKIELQLSTVDDYQKMVLPAPNFAKVESGWKNEINL